MKYFIFLFLFSLNSYSQQFIIANSLTKEPVPYAAVSCFNAGKIAGGYYSNESGLVLPDKAIAHDRLEIASIGFETRQISKELVKDTVFLYPKAIELTPVTISNRLVKPKEVLLGFLNEKKKVNVSSATKSLEAVVYIQNTTGAPATVKSFLFRIKRRTKNRTVFRIHFYEKAEGKAEPGNEILLGDIMAYRDKNTPKLVEVDVLPYNLQLPATGIFAGIEWLGVIDDNGNFIKQAIDDDRDTIEYNDAVNELLTFHRNRFDGYPWKNTASLKEDFKELVKWKNWPNASFGIKILKE
jgi:hypothetical protein